MVRLKPSFFIVYCCKLLFQFHYGTIKTAVLLSIQSDKRNFNSIMVRLKHLMQYLKSEIRAFQFHYGTIKTEGIYTAGI